MVAVVSPVGKLFSRQQGLSSLRGTFKFVMLVSSAMSISTSDKFTLKSELWR